mgnify:CR=1 FL=1
MLTLAPLSFCYAFSSGKKKVFNKFIYGGDDRNIVGVFVAGKEVVSK